MPEGSITSPEIPKIPVQETGPLGPEKAAETPVAVPESAAKNEPIVNIPEPVVAPLQPQVQISSAAALEKEVEDVLEEGLEDAYKKMDPETQKKFKEEGEKTAHVITVMLQTSRIKIKKIVDLLISWLRIIPGINRYFLEQEAKIKADKLLGLRRK